MVLSIGIFSALMFLFLSVNASALTVDHRTQECINASIAYLQTHEIQPTVESRYVVDWQ